MRIVTIIMFWVVVCVNSGYGQYLARDYTVQQWTIKDGLPVNSVNEILQAADGYLWMTTASGLVRFDGINFKVYSSADYPRLTDNRILDLVESSDGSILIQNQGGSIFSLKNDRFTHLVSSDKGRVGENIDVPFYKDKRGAIWYVDEVGISIYKDGRVEKFEPDLINKLVVQIFKAEDGIVWFKYFGDPYLYRYEHGKIERTVDSSVGEERPDLTGILDSDWLSLATKEDEEWIQTRSEIYIYKNRTLTKVYETYDRILDGLIEDSEGRIWTLMSPSLERNDERYVFLLENGRLKQHDIVITGKAMYHFEENNDRDFWIITNKEIYKKEQLVFSTNEAIVDFVIDKEESLWIATSFGGLIQIRENLFSTWSTEVGLPLDNTYTVFQDLDSSMWIGTFGKGVVKLTNQGLDSLIEINGDLNKGFILSIEQLQDGTLLLGGLGFGTVSREKGSNRFSQFPLPESMRRRSIHSIFEDSRQRLWLGTSPRDNKGLFMREKGAWEFIAGKENVPFATYQYIMETPNGDIWMAARGEGLVRYDGDNFYNYSTKDGFTSDFIRAIYAYIDDETGEEILLIGSEGDGIDRIVLRDGAPDFSTLTVLNMKNGLYDNSIHIILEDEYERFWMNTNQGIFWINKSDVNALTKGEIETIVSTSYTEEDGLLHREGNGGSQPAGIKAFDGTLWFPGQGGIVSVDPERIQRNPIPPPVHIQNAVWESRSLPVQTDEIILNADQRNFEITYAALSYSQPKKNQYRYKLEGFDDNWQDVGVRRTAYFTNVPSGTYTFKVQGSNNDGIWNTEGASIIVSIAPYFYETVWFYAISVIFIGGLIFGGIRLRTHQLEQKQWELERVVDERTDDLRREKEEVVYQKTVITDLSKAKDNFFTNISHELRTPLTLVLGPLQNMADKQSALSEDLKRNLKLALRNGFRLKQLVEQVLDLSRMDSSKIELNLVKLNIKSKIKLIVESFESLAASKKISIEAHLPEDELYAGVDSDKFQKILINLISNALKFTSANGEIDIYAKIVENELVLIVSDTGSGIEKERLPHIFDRFHSNEARVAGGGYGLGVGLNMTKEFVELHEGAISVESEIDIGTTFVITLPSCMEAMANQKETAAGEGEKDDAIYEIPQSVIPVPLPKTKEQIETHILLVEDNADMRAYIAELLDADHIQITEAGTGIEAKKQLSLMKPDLIVSDVMMPDMDGFEFTRYVRSLAEHRLTPIVMLTALSELDHRLEAFHLGVSDYLTKPFEEKELMVRIHNLLRLKAERDQATTISDEGISEGSVFVKRLKDFVTENITNPKISVEELAGIVNMSRTQLYIKLKAETGFTPAEFVREIRLLRGYQILRNKQMKRISDVSYAIGFSTPGYFTSVFEERFGIRPGTLIQHQLKD